MNALLAHIKAINAKTAAWVAKDPKHRIAGLFTEDLSYWQEMTHFNDTGIQTPEEFDRYMLANEIYDFYKTVYGYRPDFGHLKNMSLADLQKQLDSLNREYAFQRAEISKYRIARKLAARKLAISNAQAKIPVSIPAPKTGFAIGELIPALA